MLLVTRKHSDYLQLLCNLLHPVLMFLSIALAHCLLLNQPVLNVNLFFCVSVQSTKGLKKCKAQVKNCSFPLDSNADNACPLSPILSFPLPHSGWPPLSLAFCIMSCRHTLPPAFRPWGLHTGYINRGGDLFKHMFPLTKSSMSNLALPGSTNATFSFACITLKAAGQKVLELEWKLISYAVDLPGAQ